VKHDKAEQQAQLSAVPVTQHEQFLNLFIYYYFLINIGVFGVAKDSSNQLVCN
jgi:hypothetical protein